MSTDTKEFLEHHGVKGMKWGTRKRPDPNRSASKWKARKDKERAAKNKDGQPSAKKGSSSVQAKSKQLSDTELKAAVARMQLEKQYAELTAATTPPRQLTRGQKFAKEAGKVGVNIVTKAVTEVGTQAVKAELQKQFGLTAPSGGNKSNTIVMPKNKPQITTWKTGKGAVPKTKGTVWKPGKP